MIWSYLQKHQKTKLAPSWPARTSFCAGSGQKVNLKKFNIALSKGVDEYLATRISQIANIPVSTKLENYMGVPFIMGRINSKTFQHVLDRIDGRLEGWRAKNLTRTGWMILAKPVLAAIPAYIMPSTLLQKDLCNKIDRKIWQFLWDDSQARRRVHLINWETVMRRKEHERLGVWSMQNTNKVFMAKVGLWWILTHQEEL